MKKLVWEMSSVELSRCENYVSEMEDALLRVWPHLAKCQAQQGRQAKAMRKMWKSKHWTDGMVKVVSGHR